MADSSNLGCAVRLDGTLKDASKIEWHHDKDDDLPIAPVKLHPIFANQPPPPVMGVGSRRSARTLRPSARVIDPDNAMNQGVSSTSELSATVAKRKAAASLASVSRRVSRKIHVDTTDEDDSQSDGEESYSRLHLDDSDAEGLDNATDEFDALQVMADADHEVRHISPSRVMF
jgi:hypothetical protein